MDLWATVIAEGGEGNEMRVVNRYPCPPTRPWRLPSGLGRCYLLLNTHKHILPWTPLGFPCFSICCFLVTISFHPPAHTITYKQPIPLEYPNWGIYFLCSWNIYIWINWHPEQKHHTVTEALAHTTYLKVKAKAGLLEESQPTRLNIADHCLTIRWLSNKVLPKTDGSKRSSFLITYGRLISCGLLGTDYRDQSTMRERGNRRGRRRASVYV